MKNSLMATLQAALLTLVAAQTRLSPPRRTRNPMREPTSNSAPGAVGLKLRPRGPGSGRNQWPSRAQRPTTTETHGEDRAIGAQTDARRWVSCGYACLRPQPRSSGLAGSCPTCNTDHSNRHLDAKLGAAPISAGVPSPALERAPPRSPMKNRRRPSPRRAARAAGHG